MNRRGRLRDRALPLDTGDEAVDAQRAHVEQLARRIAHHRLEAPALIVLQVLKPWCFVSSHLLFLIEPFAGSWRDETRRLAILLERRSNIDLLLAQIEARHREREISL